MKKSVNVNDRPVSLPKTPWIMRQKWSELLFLHYPVSTEVLRPLIPACLEIDTFDGTAWVNVVPFFMNGIRLRGTPNFSFTPDFLELNVRTYVKFANKPGVYFFSLDANSKFAVFLANQTYSLPYYHAEMSSSKKEGWVQFYSERRVERVKQGVFAGKYRPISEIYKTIPGTLEHWLTEQYVLYVKKGNGIYEGNVYHTSWPLQKADALIEHNTVAESMGIQVKEEPALLQYCQNLDVVVWPPKKVGIFEEEMKN